jgi:cholesterol oxidase
MARLASSIDAMKPHYQVVVVGSGYGGSIIASRLARAGQEVCLLEQGRELQPGEYPETFWEVGHDLQVDLPEFHLGSRTGLYQVLANPDVNVLKGCGLGGTSLINANVAIEPDPRVFQREEWPDEIRGEAADPHSPLSEGYDRARRMLGSNEYPGTPPDIDKLRALEASAALMKARFRRPPINVTFQDGVSEGGVPQHACTRCGNCCSGCNYGAKNTTLMNYLPDAVRHGAVIFTRCSVHHLGRVGGRWDVCYQRLDSGHEAFTDEPSRLTADLVVLAGGTLGSTEILLRSQRRGLALSARLGEGFSANGDLLALGYDLDREVDGLGWERRNQGSPRVGPLISGMIDLANEASVQRGIAIEDGAVPGSLLPLLPALVGIAISRSGQEGKVAFGVDLGGVLAGLRTVLGGPDADALRRTQVYLAMAHDGGDGRMVLEGSDERLRIHWPGAADQPVLREVESRLRQATEALGGTLLGNPFQDLDLLGRGVSTVHPLGGCAMASSAADGVVNHMGQVFSGRSGGEVHPGLFVADGAIMPVPLGVNPLLTISALAERVAALLAKRNGWTIDYASSPPLELRRTPPGVEFGEWWRGRLLDGRELSLSLAISAEDLAALLEDTGDAAAVRGSASLTSGTHTRTLKVGGAFQAAQGRASYHLSLRDAISELRLDASRVVPPAIEPDMFEETTALPATLQAAGGVVSRGVLRCDAGDVRGTLGSMRVTDASPADRPGQTLAVARLLYGPLADTYGDVSAPPTVPLADAAPRKHRSLVVPAPRADCLAVEGALLKLTRYPGERTSVLLLHGLGQSSRLFTADTVRPSLVEYLAARGLDVWLLDCRGSVELASSLRPFDLDQVAAVDLPGAIDRVRAVTGRESVAVVAHGWGAAAAFMAVLSGSTTGVARLVASQLGCFVESRPISRLAAWARSDTWLERTGVSALGGYQSDPPWPARTWRSMLGRRARPEGIVGMVEQLYGPVFEKANLSTDTLAALDELYGPVAIRAGRHVQRMVRAGNLVDAAGRDVYLPGVSRLDLPVLLLQGGSNRQFRPAGTEKTLAWLRRHGVGDCRRQLVEGYGSDDAMLGWHASRDVFPEIAAFLEEERR